MNIQTLGGKAIDRRDDADGGDGDLPPAVPAEIRIGDPPDGGDNRIEIQERLPHAHEDERLETPAHLGCLLLEMQKLLDDFAGFEISLQTPAGAGAKVAPHRAANLRGD